MSSDHHLLGLHYVLQNMEIRNVTESKLALLAALHANKSETRCWGKEYDYLESQETEKMSE